MDNIGTGWWFPVQVESSGAAKVQSDFAGPYNFTGFLTGGLLYLSLNGDEEQEFLIPQGIWTADQVARLYLSNLRNGKAKDENGSLVIISHEDNPIRSSIVVRSNADISLADQRDAARVLGLPKGSVNGYGTGSIKWTRNLDPELVTVEDTENELGQALLIMILTNPGDIPIIRSFGVGLYEFLFKTPNREALSMMKYRITDGIMKWDNRVFATDLSIVTKGDSTYLQVGFVPRNSQNRGELLMPFLKVA